MQPPGINNPLALAGLLLIIPVILLYLLKPKPKKIKFPTVMFITRMEKDSRFRFFPKRFIRDPLLIIQVLLIAFLVLSIADPYLTLDAEKKPEGDIVYVLDASASMQSTETGVSRFEEAKKIINKIMDESAPKSTHTIILAQNIPALAVKKTDKEQAKTALNTLECTDTTTNIGDSIIFAKDLLAGSDKNKEIYVISDYTPGEGLDTGLASRIASKEGITTKHIQVGKAASNIAILGIEAKRYLTNKNRFYLTASIRNYDPEDRRVQGDILMDEEKIDAFDVKIEAGATKLIHVEGQVTNPQHIITVKTNNIDDLALDNTAYHSMPEIRDYKTLLITDDGSDIYLQNALEASSDIELTKAVSPVIPSFEGYDTVINGDLDKDLLLQGMYTDIKTYVHAGGKLVIIGSDDLAEIDDADLKELLPLELEWVKNIDSAVKTTEHEIYKDTVIEDIVLKKYYKATPKEEAEVLATVSGLPAIAHQSYGAGKVVYVGLNPNPEWSNFYYSSSMPIFWYQLIKWVNKKEDAIPVLNYKVGGYINAGTPITMTTPSGKTLNSTDIIFDETGIYRAGEEAIAVNLIDEKESNIAEFLQIEDLDVKTDLEKEQIQVQQDIYPYLALITLILLIVELYYYVKRGYFQK